MSLPCPGNNIFARVYVELRFINGAFVAAFSASSEVLLSPAPAYLFHEFFGPPNRIERLIVLAIHSSCKTWNIMNYRRCRDMNQVKDNGPLMPIPNPTKTRHRRMSDNLKKQYVSHSS